MEKIVVDYLNSKIDLFAKKTGVISKVFGLMFKGKRTTNLLFEFENYMKIPITSLFVFFPFLVIWLDEFNKVVDVKIVKPFQLSINSKNEFKKFIEIPINDENRKVIEFFVGKLEKFKY